MAPLWMMLDRFVFHRDDEEEGSPFLDESKAPLRASSCTSLGKRFDILFLPAEPPAISRFYMRWPDGTKSEDAKGTELVDANHDLVLLMQTSFESSGKDCSFRPTQDDFICIALFEPKLHLQLKRPPVCNNTMIFPSVDGEEETVSLQHVFLSGTVGLVRGPGHEFVVAQLAMVSKIPGKRKVEAEVCVLHSSVYANDGMRGRYRSDIRRMSIPSFPGAHSNRTPRLSVLGLE